MEAYPTNIELLPNERWRQAYGCSNYSVSTEGRIYSWHRHCLLDGHTAGNIRAFKVYEDSGHRRIALARVIWQTFVDNTIDHRHYVAYKDGNPLNCALSNLYVASFAEGNIKYTDDLVQEAAALWLAGKTYQQISNKIGVPMKTVASWFYASPYRAMRFVNGESND